MMTKGRLPTSMTVAVGSPFRNCGSGVATYMQRVALLRSVLRCNVRVVAVEGDSTDDTLERLYAADTSVYCLECGLPDWACRNQPSRSESIPLDIRICDHGGPVFAHDEAPERLQAMSVVHNAVFDGVALNDDAFVLVESDLAWGPKVMATLVQHALARTGGCDVHAPAVMCGHGFYDTLSYRDLDGKRFSHLSHLDWDTRPEPFEISSAGSCLVMRADVARACRVRNDLDLVGWCEDALRQGYRIAVHPTLRIQQP